MSFFGLFFAGFTLLSKGISKSQYLVEDHSLKERAKRIGSKTYYDHNGVMYDMETGRATSFYEINEHNIKKVEYKKILLNKEEAIEKGEEWYEVKCMESFDHIAYIKWKNKYNWYRRASMHEKGKDKWNSRDCYFSFDNLYYTNHCLKPNAMVYYGINHTGQYIREKYDEYYVYTDLNSGLVVDADEQTKEKLKEKKIKWETYKDAINDKKKCEKKIPICY